jgi:hypothetical protein
MKTAKCLALLSLVASFPSSVAAEACESPTIHELVQAALVHEGLAKPRASSWRRRLAWSSVLPKLTARVSRSAGRSEYLDLGAAPDQDLNNYLALRWEVRATWDLSRLIFDRRELAISRRESQLGAERRRLRGRVIALYYERCHLLDIRHKARMRPGSHPDGWSTEKEVRLRVITALLETLTGCRLSRVPVGSR